MDRTAMGKKTRLQKFREREGLTATALSRSADVSARTIKRLENLVDPARPQVTDVTKYKVLNGLNDARVSNQPPELTFAEVFPDQEVGDLV